jgi:glycerol uptake facilitator-like aquaporin
MALWRRLLAELIGSALLAAVVIGSGIAARRLSPGDTLADLMFSDPAISISGQHRASGAHVPSEVIATLGLVLVIFALARSGRSHAVPAAIGAYIGAAYFFTSSTSFANPAITIGRTLSATFAGIAPAAAPAFIAAQLVGGTLAVALVRVLYPSLSPAEAKTLVVPRLPSERPVP